MQAMFSFSDSCSLGTLQESCWRQKETVEGAESVDRATGSCDQAVTVVLFIVVGQP